MEITWIGYPILFLALLFFIFSPKRLYEFAIFSIPFTGTGLFHIALGEGDDGAWITPSMALGVLCLLRHLISVLYTKKIQTLKRMQTPLAFLFILAGVCILSLLITPFIGLNIDLRHDYYKVITSAQSRHFQFKPYYLTQVLYFVFGCFMAYYFAIKNNTYTKIMRSTQVYIYASLFIACWGLLEFVLFYMDIPYPSFLLNQIHLAANHQGTSVLYGRPRIGSATMETSIMSQQLLTVIPLLFFQVKNWKFYSTQIDLKICLIVIVTVLAVSTSTTAILGLLIFLLIISYEKLKQGINIYVFKALIFVLIIAFFFVAYELYQKISMTYSGQDRMNSIERGLSWFIHYPFLGIGWGVLQVFDLIVIIASHLGLVGLFVFLLLLFSININFTQPALDSQQDRIRKALQYSLVMVLIISEISAFIFYRQYFWLVLGLAIAGSALTSSKSKSKPPTIAQTVEP